MNKHIVFLIFFFLIFSLVPLAEAVAPSVGTVTADDPINLLESSTVNVLCNSTVADVDGWANITMVNATIWHSSSTEGASDDNNYHYTNSSCSLGTNVSETELPASCSFPMEYYSNSGTWSCKLRAYDGSSEAGNETNTTVNSLIALNIPNTLDFGSMDLGETSTNDTENETSIENTGNTLIDIQLSGDSMSCTSGSIAVSNIKYSDTDNTEYSSMTALSGTSTTINLDVAQRTDGASIKDIFWRILIPSTGAGGSCSNTITFTAIAG